MSRPRIGIDARHAARGLGIATFIDQIARALHAAGRHEPVWLGSESVAPEGIESHPVAGPYPRLDVLDAGRTVRRHRLDGMLFGGNSGPTRSLAVPTVLVVHDLLFFDEPRPSSLRPMIGHLYERWNVPRAISAATAVATVSQTSRDAIEALAPGTDATVIPHGMTTRAAAGTPVVEGAIVAFSGRDARKRTDLVLDAYRRLAAPRPPLVLFSSAGSPPDLDAALEALHAMGDVHVTGHLPRADVDATIAAALALVYPSEREGFGLPVLEGMAAGAPVITGLAPSTREIAGGAALLIDEADPAGSIVAVIERLRADAEERERWRQLGLAHAAGFTWAGAGEAYAGLLDRALGSAR